MHPSESETHDAGLGGGEAAARKETESVSGQSSEARAPSVNSSERDGPRDARSDGPPLGARLSPGASQAALDREELGRGVARGGQGSPACCTQCRGLGLTGSDSSWT